MEQWMLLRKGAEFDRIAKKFHISPRLACLIRNRDVIGDEAIEQYLNGGISKLSDGYLMKDMEKSISILKEKIENHKKIRVIGDYDIDGVNATYILLEGLEKLGAEVDSDIPDRMKDGYGLNMDLIERAVKDGADTIITCDNGIAAKEEIAYAKSLGMTVIVTDHHEVPFEESEGEKYYILPPADAVIDPKQADCSYPFKGLCGAAVAYQLMVKLIGVFGRSPDELSYLIENVAIATVGDVMDLTGENRIFVKEGLLRLRNTKNPGLKALIECTGLDRNHIGSYHIGFVIGPCLNAGGRLDTAKRALALLRAKTEQEAKVLAEDLKALNDSRKDMTAKAVEQAAELVENQPEGKDKVLLLYLPDCHESLAGIVAGRIRERYWKPVFILTDAAQGVKGSGRSIEAYHMYEGLNRCKELLDKYGGHKLAAGLSLKKENIAPLRRMLNEFCTLTEQDMAEKVSIDMELPFSCVTEKLVSELELLEPFGKGNTKPVFAARNVFVLEGRILGKNHNVLKLRVRDSADTSIEAMFFGDIDRFFGYLEERFGAGAGKRVLGGRADGMKISVTYYPGINKYQGRRSPQIVITHYR
ncbi:single-stranded-DNA-specific exonuclease RecJ [Lachnospiraceae bacterium MD308]|nr:single-stranded-DNA-specific exonuclease RecJ [Lachnospiraceae bacterium MD308]